MSKNIFSYELSNIKQELKDLLEDIESHYNLKKGLDYQITTNYKVFHGFYNGIKVFTSQYTDTVDIWISFHKSKVDGTKSKIKTGCFIADVRNIVELPF